MHTRRPSQTEMERRLEEVKVSRDQVVQERRDIIKKGVYLAGAGALAATTAGMLASFLPPYVNPFVDGTYEIKWATSEASSAWANDKEGQPMKASDFPRVGLGGQGIIGEVAMNVLVAYLDPKFIDPTMVGLIPYKGGRFASFNTKCKHLGCNVLWRGKDEAERIVPPLDPPIQHDILVCPCHLGTYDIYNSAKLRFGPPPEPLDQLKLILEDDQFKVQFTKYKYAKNATGGQVEGNPWATG